MFIVQCSYSENVYLIRTAKNDLTYEIKVPEPVVRMQNFVTELFENVQHFLSYLCSNIGKLFFLI
jgi:hypothetical protein